MHYISLLRKHSTHCKRMIKFTHELHAAGTALAKMRLGLVWGIEDTSCRRWNNIKHARRQGMLFGVLADASLAVLRLANWLYSLKSGVFVVIGGIVFLMIGWCSSISFYQILRNAWWGITHVVSIRVDFRVSFIIYYNHEWVRLIIFILVFRDISFILGSVYLSSHIIV